MENHLTRPFGVRRMWRSILAILLVGALTLTVCAFAAAGPLDDAAVALKGN